MSNSLRKALRRRLARWLRTLAEAVDVAERSESAAQKTPGAGQVVGYRHRSSQPSALGPPPHWVALVGRYAPGLLRPWPPTEGQSDIVEGFEAESTAQEVAPVPMISAGSGPVRGEPAGQAGRTGTAWGPASSPPRAQEPSAGSLPVGPEQDHADTELAMTRRAGFVPEPRPRPELSGASVQAPSLDRSGAAPEPGCPNMREFIDPRREEGAPGWETLSRTFKGTPEVAPNLTAGARSCRDLAFEAPDRAPAVPAPSEWAVRKPSASAGWSESQPDQVAVTATSPPSGIPPGLLDGADGLSPSPHEPPSPPPAPSRRQPASPAQFTEQIKSVTAVNQGASSGEATPLPQRPSNPGPIAPAVPSHRVWQDTLEGPENARALRIDTQPGSPQRPKRVAWSERPWPALPDEGPQGSAEADRWPQLPNESPRETHPRPTGSMVGAIEAHRRSLEHRLRLEREQRGIPWST